MQTSPGASVLSVTPVPHEPDHDTAKGAIEAYNYCNRTLRAWLATYSVAVPAFLFTKQNVMTNLTAHHAFKQVALLFAIAVALQVFLTFLNKYAQWGVYARYATKPMDNPITRFCERLSEIIVIDLTADLLTIVALTAGTAVAFQAVVPA